MGRVRKQADAWMPQRVYRGRSAYEFKPTNNITIRLCSLDSSRAVVIRRHAEEYDQFHTKAGSIKALAEMYFKSPDYTELAFNTRKDYAKYWLVLDKVFGKMKARSLLPEHVRKYMDLQGQRSKVQANRHLSLLSKMFSWGFERGHVSVNPCKGVSRFTERARTRYIEDWEYQAVYDAATDAVKAAMEISYCCAARQGDVLAMTKHQIRPDGIYIKQGKTGKEQVKLWSDRLRKAVALAESIETRNGSIYVIPTTTGTAYTSDGFRTMWTRAKDKAKAVTGAPLDFTFHDIKARAISDYEGDKQRFSGHKTAAQVATYDRKVQRVESIGGRDE